MLYSRLEIGSLQVTRRGVLKNTYIFKFLIYYDELRVIVMPLNISEIDSLQFQEKNSRPLAGAQCKSRVLVDSAFFSKKIGSVRAALQMSIFLKHYELKFSILIYYL